MNEEETIASSILQILESLGMSVDSMVVRPSGTAELKSGTVRFIAEVKHGPKTRMAALVALHTAVQEYAIGRRAVLTAALRRSRRVDRMREHQDAGWYRSLKSV